MTSRSLVRINGKHHLVQLAGPRRKPVARCPLRSRQQPWRSHLEEPMAQPFPRGRCAVRDDAVVLLALILAAAGCGGSPTRTTSTISTTSVASTTTTTVPGLSGTITVQDTPCVAPASGQVSCTFVASASGGPSPSFSWRFTNPANGQVVTASGQSARPDLGCNVSSGVATFQLSIVLTITASGSTATVTGTQQIARAAGACGL